MQRTLRAALIGLVSTAATFVAADPAGASGTGPVRVRTLVTIPTTTNGTFSVLTPGGARIITCRSISYRESITASGSVSIPNGSASFSSCTFSGLNVTVTQDGDWSAIIRHLDDVSGSVSAFTLSMPDPSFPTRKFRERISGAGCTFVLEGTYLADWSTTSPIRSHSIDYSIDRWHSPALLATRTLTLTTSGVAGTCALLGIANGQTAGFGGDAVLVSAVVASAIH